MTITTNDGNTFTMVFPTPADGVDGISIVDVKVNEQNHLICTMSDNTTIDAGEILGIKQSGGGLLQFNSKTNFPTNGEKDVIYLALDTESLYYWNEETNSYKPIIGSGNKDENYATKEDIDKLFENDGDYVPNPGYDLATPEDIDKLFPDEGNPDIPPSNELDYATTEDIDNLFKEENK